MCVVGGQLFLRVAPLRGSDLWRFLFGVGLISIKAGDGFLPLEVR